MTREVVVVSAVRTAIGTFGGSLKDIAPTELGAQVVRDFSEMAKEIFDERQILSPEALRDFARIIGNGDYKFCADSNFSGRSLDRISTYTSITSPYKIQFIVSFED